MSVCVCVCVCIIHILLPLVILSQSIISPPHISSPNSSKTSDSPGWKKPLAVAVAGADGAAAASLLSAPSMVACSQPQAVKSSVKFTCKYCGVDNNPGTILPHLCAAADARWGACCRCALHQHCWPGWGRNECTQCREREKAAHNTVKVDKR